MSPNTMNTKLDEFTGRAYTLLRTWAEPSLIGPSMFRVLFGAVALYQLLINYAQRAYLYGPDGVWPFDLFRAELLVSGSFSLYAWSASPIWFELVYHAHLAVAGLWLLGYRTRLLTPVLWVFHWSLHQRFGLLWDGGDNMGYLILLYLCFADVGRYFAPLGSPRPEATGSEIRRVALGLLHNTALIACVLQVSLLYFSAGVAKLGGQYWQNGTALYYAMRAQEFSVNPELARFIWDNALLLTASTYGTLIFQLAFPFVLLFGTPLFRCAIVGVAISFHFGILSAMGLVTFGLFMLSYEPLLLRDHELRAIGGLLQRATGVLRLPSLTMDSRVRDTQPATEEA
jgi:hypothetical protein